MRRERGYPSREPRERERERERNWFVCGRGFTWVFDFSGSTAMAVGGATLVHCGATGGDERSAHLAIPSGALAPSLNAALGSTINSALGNIGSAGSPGATSWPPTIWQYPTAGAISDDKLLLSYYRIIGSSSSGKDHRKDKGLGEENKALRWRYLTARE